MIRLAVEQSREPTLDRHEAVRVRADRDPVAVRRSSPRACRAALRAFGLVVGALLVAEAETNRVEARARECDTGVA